MTPSASFPRIFARHRLLTVVSLLLAAGFFATSLSSYHVSRQAIHEALVARELPLTSSNISSEIQKDLVRPVLISSTMANDTFLRSWVLEGESRVEEMALYLKAVKERYGAFSSFFVSDRTGLYYTADGILKRVSPDEPRDIWYYRVREMPEPYEINVDPDLANRDALTIFINYRVFDFSGNLIGATGIGLTVDAVRKLIADYQARHQRTIYFAGQDGRIVLFANESGRTQTDLRRQEGLGAQVDRILAEKTGSYQYEAGGELHLVHVTYVPELKWFLFVERIEGEALREIRQALYVNLAICLLITLVVVGLTHLALALYQQRIEEMAATDKLTGLLNRQAFDLLMDQLGAEIRREAQPVAILLADIDRFKEINDRHGHLVGDRVLVGVASLIRGRLRASDLAARWGGEEFLLVLKGCDLDEAARVGEELRRDIEKMTFSGNGQTLSVTMSIGVSDYRDGEPIDQAVGRADIGLYRAKATGRNRVCIVPPRTQAGFDSKQ